MSATLPGTRKVLVKIPYEEWKLLQRFKGGNDGDRILRLIELANANLTIGIKEHKEKIHAEQVAAEEAAKPSLIHRVSGLFGGGK